MRVEANNKRWWLPAPRIRRPRHDLRGGPGLRRAPCFGPGRSHARQFQDRGALCDCPGRCLREDNGAGPWERARAWWPAASVPNETGTPEGHPLRHAGLLAPEGGPAPGNPRLASPVCTRCWLRTSWPSGCCHSAGPNMRRAVR
jgi:hypothetical protein